MGGLGEPILDFTFHDNWYPATDGAGFSLVILNENAALDTWGLASSWRPSSELLGSPGTAGAAPPNLPVVLVNEALTHPPVGQLDGIELYNPNNIAVDIGGWYLTDDFKKPKKFRIPGGASIAAHGYKVYSELDFNAGPNAFALSSKGDSVYLFSGNAAGDLTGYVHGFDFGAAPLAQTFGRYVVSSGEDHFVAQTTPTFGGLNAGPLVGPVVISEFVYHPPDLLVFGNLVENTADEFIELKNITGGPVNLFDSNHPNNTWQLRTAVSFHFPTNVTLLAGGVALVVSFDPADATAQANFRARFGVPGGVPLFGPWAGHLDNSSASVELTRPDAPVPPPASNAGTVSQILVDEVRYSKELPWSAADGTQLSVQRIQLAQYGNDPINWTAASPSAGAAFAGGARPVITMSPTNQTVLGSINLNATFSVAATSPTPFGYQWQRNGVNLTDRPDQVSGATSATLTILNVTSEDAGAYQAVVYNGGGFVSSDMATLTVLISAKITRQPASQSIRVGSPVTFSVIATSATPLHYQWKYNGAVITDATNPTYVIPAVLVSHEGNYSVVVTDSVGSVPSAVAQLTVLVTPVFTRQPQSVIAVQGDTVNFSASVSTTSHPLPISFRWKKDTTSLVHRPPGTNVFVSDFSSTLTLANVQLSQAGKYTVLVTNLATSNLTSDPTVTLTVLVDTDGDHIPDDWEVLYNLNPNDPNDGALDTDGDTMTNYQEYIAGTDPTSRLSYLKVDAIATGPAGTQIEFLALSNKTYTVQFREGAGVGRWTGLAEVASQPSNRVERVTDLYPRTAERLYRLVVPASVPEKAGPVILVSPRSANVLSNDALKLTVVATGQGTLSYQWRRDGNGLVGASGAELFLSGATLVSGSYTVVVGDAVGSVESEAAVVRVLEPPRITSQPASQTVRAGVRAVLSVVATGFSPLRYYWMKDGKGLAGENSAMLVLPSVSLKNSGSYSVVITHLTPDGVVGVSSSKATVTVIP